jgi:hypothetical protein
MTNLPFRNSYLDVSLNATPNPYCPSYTPTHTSSFQIYHENGNLSNISFSNSQDKKHSQPIILVEIKIFTHFLPVCQILFSLIDIKLYRDGKYGGCQYNGLPVIQPVNKSGT